MGISKLLFLAFSMTLHIAGQESGITSTTLIDQNSFGPEGIFVGSGMSGVVITLSFGYPGSDLRSYISHLDGCQGGIEPFVPTLRASSFNSLLDVVGREHSIDHRDAGLKSDRSNPL